MAELPARETVLTYRWVEQPSPALAAGFALACRRIEAVCDVRFVETRAESATFAVHPDASRGTGAADLFGPDLWIDPGLEAAWGGFAPGTYSFFVVMHEIMHLLGLEHPPAGTSMAESAMADQYVLARSGEWLDPESPMPDDIERLTSAYGPDPVTEGNSRHVVKKVDGLSTLFDAGGERDLIDLSGAKAGCFVQLGADEIQSETGLLRLVGIEGVVLSKGADTVILGPGDVVLGADRLDRLLADDTGIERLSKRDLRDQGLAGKWYEIDGAYVSWGGAETKLAAIVVQS